VLAGANRHDAPLWEPTLGSLFWPGFALPGQITVRLDAGYDSAGTHRLLKMLGCDGRITPKVTYIEINHTNTWRIERANFWHTRGFALLQVVLDRARAVQEAWTELANAIIVLPLLLKETWTHYRWETRPIKQYHWRQPSIRAI
jgi:hypothetical protein